MSVQRSFLGIEVKRKTFVVVLRVSLSPARAVNCELRLSAGLAELAARILESS